MVASEDRDALGISDLEGDEQGDGFDRVVTSIDIVTWLYLLNPCKAGNVEGCPYP